jgi:Uma2 family endonuclease
MATGTLASLDEYLHTIYRPDCDYIDGEVQERNLGEKDHSKAQRRILLYLCAEYPSHAENIYLELRIRISATRYRIPDVCILAEDAPDEQVPTHPPLLCIEILSPEDRMSRYMERVNDYFQMGVPCCWILDPTAHRAWVATPGLLAEATDGVLHAGDLKMPLSAVLQ